MLEIGFPRREKGQILRKTLSAARRAFSRSRRPRRGKVLRVSLRRVPYSVSDAGADCSLSSGAGSASCAAGSGCEGRAGVDVCSWRCLGDWAGVDDERPEDDGSDEVRSEKNFMMSLLSASVSMAMSSQSNDGRCVCIDVYPEILGRAQEARPYKRGRHGNNEKHRIHGSSLNVPG